MGLWYCGISLLLVILTSKATDAIQCRSCGHAATPGDCQTWTHCGTGEICFTREFKESDGKQAFHLGCEATSLCTLYLDAENVGSIDHTDGGSLCYNCCLTDDCNKDLCQGSVPKPTTKPRPKACPDFYMEISSKCYFIGTWESSWQAARQYCKKTKDSDLASFNAQAESDQVNLRLIKLAAPVTSYWLGGFYSPASSEWEWVDRTRVVANGWERNYPPKTLNHTLDYYIVQPKPVNGKASKWRTDTRDHHHGFICELDL